MKLIFILFVFSIGAFAETPWQCPLRLEKPERSAIFDAYVEPLDIIIQDSYFEINCKKLHSAAKKLREKILILNDEINSANKKAPDENMREVAAQLSSLIVSLLTDTRNFTQTGKLCNGKDLSESAKTTLANLVSFLTKANDDVRAAYYVSDGVLRLTKEAEKLIVDIRAAVREQLAFNEEKYLKQACDFLEAEYLRSCLPGTTPAAPSAKEIALAEKVRTKVESHIKAHAKMVKARLASKSLVERVLAPWRSKEKLDLQSGMGQESAFYRFVMPELKFCAMGFALGQYPDEVSAAERAKENLRAVPFVGRLIPKEHDYLAYCNHFFCSVPDASHADSQRGKGVPLFSEPTTQQGFVQSQKAFCTFVDDYRVMEQRYLKGFSERFGANVPAGEPFKLCPSGDGTSTRVEVMARFRPDGVPHAEVQFGHQRQLLENHSAPK